MFSTNTIDVWQAAGTITATQNGASNDTRVGNLDAPLWLHIPYSAASNATGANAVQFDIQHSSDNVNWYEHTSGAYDTINLTVAPQGGEIFIPVLSKLRYKRLVTTISGAGTAPTITLGSCSLCTGPY